MTFPFKSKDVLAKKESWYICYQDYCAGFGSEHLLWLRLWRGNQTLLQIKREQIENMILSNFLFRGSRSYHFRGKLDMINDYCFLCTYWLASYGWWLYAYSDKSTLVENAPWLNVIWPCDTGAFITRMSYISTDEQSADIFLPSLLQSWNCVCQR